jgi:hypothetical protein
MNPPERGGFRIALDGLLGEWMKEREPQMHTDEHRSFEL